MWQDFDDWMEYVKSEEERLEGKRREEGAHYLPFWHDLYIQGINPTDAVLINVGKKDYPS